jgi:uncharacterized protein
MRVRLLSEDKKAQLNTSEVPSPSGFMQFENGALTKQQLDSMLNTLPVEITFIDANDSVCFFNKPEKIIFVRAKGVIGRKVQNCHPAASLDTVNKIVESFKLGKKNIAEFWIDMADKKVHIRFFAVRDAQNKYLGTMEIVQDVTEIQKLTGEKRLLDWQE